MRGTACGERLNRRRREPVRELHFLRFLADHHQQYDAKHHTREHEHLLVGQALVRHEREDGDDAGEQQTDRHAVEHDG